MAVANPVSTEENPVKLTSGRLLAGNVAWNLLGTSLPVVVALVCLPILKRSLGTDRLGVISLAWVVIGYFGFFDLGLSRALTKLVAEKLGQKRTEEIPSLVWTSLWMMLVFGFTGLVFSVLLSRWLLAGPLRIPPGLQHEALISFYWLSVSLPFVVVTAGLRGVLEALQCFRLATAIRIPMGIFTYLGPVIILPFSHSLVAIMATLVLGRAAACVAHFWACLQALPVLRTGASFERSLVRPLVSFGGWMTVSNVVGPFMLWFDRFLIAALVSVSAAAYYGIPNEVVIRLTIVPYVVLGVLFPAFSTANAHDPVRVEHLWQATLRYIFMAQFPIVLLLIAFAPEALRLWLGPDFALHSTTVARWLLVAIFVNSLATVPFSHLQSTGRPDITAKLQLFELGPYACVLYLLAKHFGIEGVAVAWFLRMAVEAVFLFWLSTRILPASRPAIRKLGWMVAAAVATFVLAASVKNLEVKIPLISAICIIATMSIWFWMLSHRERDFLSAALSKLLRFS